MDSDTEIWKENLLSHYRAEFKEAVLGVDRMREALEGAARDNLSQLVSKLSDVLIKSKKNNVLNVKIEI